MNWSAKQRGDANSAPHAPSDPGPAAPVSTPRNVRLSNGLKDFLWLLNDVKHGRLLDLGPVWQSTVGFFIERGFRVSTEDLLRCWKDFLNVTEEELRAAPVGKENGEMNSAMLAERFLEYALAYPAESFHAVLAWDIFDYLEADLMKRVVNRLYELLRPGGAVLAIFHIRPADRFHRYRIVEAQSIELLPAPPLAQHQRIFQNRELLDLFEQFRSSKTYVGRDQLREGLFLK
jgi:hypothetical protein